MRTRRPESSSDPMPLGGHRPTRATREWVNRVAHREAGHTSVLLTESIAGLALEPDDAVIDATLGGGGHAKAILKELGPKGMFLGIDADEAAVERARALTGEAKIVLRTGNFRDIERIAEEAGMFRITKALFDLGWSGYQLHAGRGFSFRSDEPLIMTYAKEPSPEALTAEKIVNSWDEDSIADVLWGWGEEKFSRQIARAIITARRNKRIRTTKELAEIIRGAVPAFYRKSRLHPATKTFQALRIAVNDEIDAVKEGLAGAWKLLASSGRIAVITFHSVEDREVKRLFRGLVARGEGRLVHKSPLTPSPSEIRANPRSRSAKLRVIEKL